MTESGRRDLNPRHPPWQGGALPLSYSRASVWFRANTLPDVGLREKGLEPLRLTALDPKSSVSTNFTTLAYSTEPQQFGQGVEPYRDRTCDPRIKSPLLYQLS